MNEMLNNIAAEGEFIPTVRTSVVDLFFRDDITDEQRGLTKTIADKEEWPKEEKQYETAFRLFPDILSEQVYGYFPIQWISMSKQDNTYNLKSVSLIPIVIKMGIELQQFDEELRGGLLSLYPNGRNTLQHIICYFSKNNELRDDCFSAVLNWMRENNYLLIEDIREYNLFGKLFATDIGFLSESRGQYLINMDPVPLSLPCQPENGDCLPIHWSTTFEDIRVFSFVLKVGMQHYPEKFGFVFSYGTQRDTNGVLYRGTPFQEACEKYGQENMINEIINCITEYCSAAVSSSTSANNNITETSLLMSAITDETIHIDGVYNLLRKDPEAALLRLQQHLLEVVGDKGQTMVVTSTDIGTYTDTDMVNNNNNNNNSGVASDNTTDSTTTSSTFNLTSSSTTASSSSSSDTIAAAIVSSTTTTTATANSINDANANANANTNDNNTCENVTHQTPLPTKKKRKHELI